MRFFIFLQLANLAICVGIGMVIDSITKNNLVAVLCTTVCFLTYLSLDAYRYFFRMRLKPNESHH